MGAPAIPIDKGIPLPAFGPGRTYRSIYPFEQMQVGDSFFVTPRQLASVRSLVHRRHVKGADRFVVALHEGEYRCWRTA